MLNLDSPLNPLILMKIIKREDYLERVAQRK